MATTGAKGGGRGGGHLAEPVLQVLRRGLAVDAHIVEGTNCLRAVMTQLADLEVLQPAGVLQLEGLENVGREILVRPQESQSGPFFVEFISA